MAGWGRTRFHGGPRASGKVRDDSGYVTAELAVALSTLVFVVGVLLWGIVLGATQIQCVDGARVGARAAARGEPTEAVRDAVRSVAPEDSDIGISTEGRSGARKVRVTVRIGMDGPGPLTLPLEAEAVGFLEPGAGADR